MKNITPQLHEEEKQELMADVENIGEKVENRLRGLTKLEEKG